MAKLLIAAVLILASFSGCSDGRAESDYVRLSELSFDEGPVQVAVEAIVSAVRKAGDTAAQFYVIGVEKTDGHLVLSLSHEDDLLPENRGMRGSLSGSKDCAYDLAEMELISCTYWR